MPCWFLRFVAIISLHFFLYWILLKKVTWRTACQEAKRNKKKKERIGLGTVSFVLVTSQNWRTKTQFQSIHDLNQWFSSSDLPRVTFLKCNQKQLRLEKLMVNEFTTNTAVAPQHTFLLLLLWVLGLKTLKKPQTNKQPETRTPNAKSQEMSYTKGIQYKLVNTQAWE